jgi:hypothetical protein
MKKVKSKYQKENFEPIVKSSKSIKEVLNKLQLSYRGSSYKTIKKYIKLYNIDTSHFLTKKQNYDATLGKYISTKHKRSLSDIMTKNSSYTNTSHLKERLYKEGLKKRECEWCGQGELWNGRKMALILDHINGDPTDHRKENLQILCPNCNATTKTFSRGHKKLK